MTAEEPESDYESDRLTHDELTGVLNRQAGFAALGRELDRCRRAGERFVLGYLNVDGLKAVNSIRTSGGDELLRKVTAALRATLRSYDVIMRLGGDGLFLPSRRRHGHGRAAGQRVLGHPGRGGPRRFGVRRLRGAPGQRHTRRDHLPGRDGPREEPAPPRPQSISARARRAWSGGRGRCRHGVRRR